MAEPLKIRKVVLYKHGVGYFEREGTVEGDAQVELGFKTGEVSDVLKSLTVLDLDGGHVSSISYDATTPAWKALEGIAIRVDDGRGLLGLLPQLQGAEVEVALGSERVRGRIVGVDVVDRRVDDAVVPRHRLSLLSEGGETVQVDMDDARSVRVLDEKLAADLDFYLRTQLAAKKEDARVFTLFAQGEGARRLRASYTLETPVWKATYRVLLPEAESDDEPLVQGWAVVDNTQDEDWIDVDLSLIAGLPVSFVHDLYSPRYLKRPVVEVREQSAIAPPAVEEAMYDFMESAVAAAPPAAFGAPAPQMAQAKARAITMPRPVSSVEVQTRERQVGDLFRYEITRPVTIKRNQSALVPIVLRAFRGRSVLLYNPTTRERNPLSAVEFENTTGLTLEGGPVTVIEGDTYAGEAMVETIKPAETRLIPYSVELAVLADSTSESRSDRVHRTRISRGVLFAFSMEVRRTVYKLANKSGRERTLYVEHRRDYGWDLVEPASAHETTPGFYRFRTELGPGASDFVVAERREVSSTFALVNVTPDVVADYRSARYIDERVAAALDRVVALKSRAAEIDRETGLISTEHSTITNDQHRVRENLKSIGDGHDEKQYKSTLVQKLRAQEERLDELASSLRLAQQERQQVQSEIDAAVGGLEFETTIG